jgi:putative hydrolase of the HAD superfamily
MNKKYHFDLDDTLYNEIDYLNSAYKEIALFIAEKSQDQLLPKIFIMICGFFILEKKTTFLEIILKYNLKTY